MERSSIEAARSAKKEATAIFSRFGKVAGVGITLLPEDGYGLKVDFQEEPASRSELPQTVKGVPVRIEVVGRIRKASVSAD